jgi:hypothetical protein
VINSGSLEIFNKCKKPNVAILKEILLARLELSNVESNLVTYMAGFSHYEFAEKILSEFGLTLICKQLIVFDSLQKKFHLKILINDLKIPRCFNNVQILEELDCNETFSQTTSSFTNIIKWRNKDGSYIDNIRDEISHFDSFQYVEYCKNHLRGVLEDIDSYEIKYDNIIFVLHFITIPKNIDANLDSLLNRVSNAFFSYSYDDRPNLSIYNLRKNYDIYPLLSMIQWNVLEIDSYLEITNFLNEIKAGYTLIPYRGEEYNYFDDFVSNILSLYAPKIKLLNLI